MKYSISILTTLSGILILATILIFACSESNQVDSEVLTENISELSAKSAHALPPVTGDPAFTLGINDPDIEWIPCFEFMPDDCEMTVIQGNPEGPNADALLKLQPNTTVDEHWHSSTERMILLSGKMEVDYVGQDPVLVEKGSYAYGPAGLAHETHCLDEGECILFIAFEDPVDAIPVTDEPAPGSEEEAFVLSVPEVEFAGCPDFFPEGCGLGILQGNPAENNADALLRLTPGSKVPMHWHTSAERMILLSGEFRVNYQGQAPVVMGAFEYAYGPPKLPHDARCLEQEDDCLLFIAFEEPVDAVDIRSGNIPHRGKR